MMQSRASTKSVVLTVMNKTVLIPNDANRSFRQKGRYSSRLGETVMHKFLLTQNDGKRSLHQKSRFSRTLGERAMTNLV